MEEDTRLSAGRNVGGTSSENLLGNKETRASAGELFESRRWIPGVAKNMPWKFLLVLLGTFVWAVGCIGVIFAADNSKVDSWTISPTVILAILGPLASMMLQYALSCGLIITWWNSALSGTTFGALHRQWDHGTSIVAASTSGRHMDKIALAKIMVLSVFAVNPLLQRALSTNLRIEVGNVTLSTHAATNVLSLQNINFTDAYRDAFYDPVQLAPNMTRIMQQFSNREPITGAVSGCTGNCSGTLVAAGIDARCSTVRNTSFVADLENGGGGATLVFATGTNKMGYRTGTDFNLTVFYVETNTDDDDSSSAPGDAIKSCHGVSTNITCVLQHAVVEYPFSSKDGVISPETQISRINIVSTEPTLHNAGEPDDEPIFGGLSIAADSIFNSSGSVTTMGKYGWALRTSGPLTAAYLASAGDVQSFARNCAVAFNDPTEDILSKLNEIVLRIALTASNSSTQATEFTAQQHTVVVIYQSRHTYLWGALAITILAAAVVTSTATGFHGLGRPVSLSPVEIATAFGSPLLQKPGTSNMTIVELLTAYKGTRIQYLSTDGSGTEDMTGDSKKRLQLTDPGQGTKPRAQETFTG